MELFDDPLHELIEQYTAFVDNPIPLIYQELDELHSGSKFIHTIRDDTAWLRSVKWLFTDGRLKFRWDEDPMVETLHQRLYGTTEFDPSIFLKRYQKHNAEVRRYFEGRPDDIAFLDITRGEGYDVLCRFLGLTVPSIPFPHRNRAEPAWKGCARRFGRRTRIRHGSR